MNKLPPIHPGEILREEFTEAWGRSLAPWFAKRTKCVQLAGALGFAGAYKSGSKLAGAFGRFDARESGSKLAHSKRFAPACAMPGKTNDVGVGSGWEMSAPGPDRAPQLHPHRLVGASASRSVFPTRPWSSR
jgi:hypothetical protein